MLSCRLREVKNNRRISTTNAKSGRGRLQEVLTSDLTRKNVVFWKSGHLQEVVAKGGSTVFPQ